MMTPDATTPLTFNSVFTLPFTGGRKWVIRDLRPRDVTSYEPVTVAEARLEGSLMELSYAPSLGGWVRGHLFFDKEDGEQVLDQVRALPVNMANRTEDEWLTLYQERVERAMCDDIDEGEVLWTIDRLVGRDDIDHRKVRAHAAAATAVKLAGPGAQSGLFAAVYETTLTSLTVSTS